MNDLLGTLLDISRLDAGVMRPRIDRVSLPSLFNSLKSDYAPLAARKGLQLRFVVRDLHVESDRTMLRRILQNLISNAIRYTTKGGVVVGARRRGERIALEVTDTGWGISPDQFEEIFEEFIRGRVPPGEDAESGGGLGLGLSIVKRMVAALDHELHLRSREMVGSRFSLLVPVAKPAPAQPASAPAARETRPAGGLTGRHVLLIENDQHVIEAMLSLLTSWGCETTVATTTGGAMAALDEDGREPEIVIADQHLDKGDLGTETVLALRARFARAIPAIIVTADPSPSLEVFTRGHEMELMVKPVKPAQLRALLSHMASARRLSMRIGG